MFGFFIKLFFTFTTVIENKNEEEEEEVKTACLKMAFLKKSLSLFRGVCV